MNGWIKISRDIADWQHYQEPSVVMVFLDLLLHANYEDSWFRGIRVKRGENVNSIRTMAQRLGMSTNTVQSALRKLVESGEIIRTPFKYGIKTTIRNYNTFQSIQDLKEDVSAGVSNGVSNGVSKNDTLKENKNKEDNTPTPRARLERETILNSGWLDQMSMSLHSPDVMQIATDIMNEWELQGIPADQWNRERLFRYIRNEINFRKREGKPSRQEAKEARRADLKQKALQDLIAATNGIYQQPTDRNGYNSRQ